MNTLIRNLVCFTAAIGMAAVATAVIALASGQGAEGSAAAEPLGGGTPQFSTGAALSAPDRHTAP